MSIMNRSFTFFTIALSICLGQSSFAKSPLDGAVLVVNQRSVPVSISIDFEKVGTVPAASVKTFKNVPNGRRIIRYQNSPNRHAQRTIDVPISGKVSFTIVKRTRRIILTNPNPRSMWVSVNDGASRMVRAKGTTALNLTYGKHVLGIRPVGSSTTSVVKQELRVHRDASTMLQLPLYYASLTIKSRQHRGADIFVDGRLRGRLHRGGSVTLTAIEPGRRRIELKRNRRTVASAHLHFGAGQTHQWNPGREAKANLKLINARSRAVQIQINGRRPVTVAAYNHTFIRNLPLGYHEVTWRGLRGQEQSEFVRVTAANSVFTIPAKAQEPRGVPAARTR